MDFSLGVLTGIYAVVAIVISYIVYIIEVKLDLPKLVNGNHELNSNNTHNNNHSSNGTTFIDLSQTRLRQLIDAIIAEAVRLPLTLSSTAASEVAFDTQSNSGNPLAQIKANGDAKSIKNHRTEHYFEPKIYQELLATAVLNRIADIHGNVRPLSGSSADFSAPDANQNFKDDRSSSSGSSVGPRSDLSFTDNDHILNLNLGDDFGSRPSLRSDVITKLQLDAGRESALSDYVAAHTIPLPDLSAPATESEEDDYTSIASSQIGDGNWENNWLLKKRKSSLSSTVTAGSVGMLVPAPKDDVRAQIGDKIADETSDLSEMGSDTDDSSLELMHGQLDPLNDRLLNKHLIGGKNTKLVLDELIDQSSMVSGTSPAEHEPICTDTTNAHVCQEATKTEAINDAFAMTLLESSPRTSNSIASPSETIIHQPLRHYDDNGNRKSNLEVDAENPITGSIAEREYKKWYNAVDMPNNPYSPEALQRRISGSQEKYIDLPNISPSTELNPISMIETGLENEVVQEEQMQEREYKRYSRDYYINGNKTLATNVKPKTLPVGRHQDNDGDGDGDDDDDDACNEVNHSRFVKVDGSVNKTSNISNHNQNPEIHCTSSTPLCRSRFLKHLSKSSPKLSYFDNRSSPLSTPSARTAVPAPHYYTDSDHYQPRRRRQQLLYNEIHCNDQNKNKYTSSMDNIEYDNISDCDTLSQYSWRNAATLPKRRTQSSLSFNSYSNLMPTPPSPPKYAAHIATAKILSQFEKQLLHKDLKRNSFRAITTTTKDFVLNPLFDKDHFYIENSPKVSPKSHTDDHRSDSGVDSYLNGCSEIDSKNKKSKDYDFLL